MVVRVATWNLGHRFGDFEGRLEAIVATLRAECPDIVCLQEVWAMEGGTDQVDLLADALDLQATRTPSIFWRGFSYGNAILTRWPILTSETVGLHDANGAVTPRTMLFATIDAPSHALTVVSTHFEHRFDRSSTRLAQAKQLCLQIADRRSNSEQSFPVIVGGDFNALPDSDEMRALTGRTAPPVSGLVLTDAWEIAGDGSAGHTWCRTNPHLADSLWPNRRLDYVMVSWPRPKGVGIPMETRLIGHVAANGVVASDHYGVVADLRTE